MFSNFRVKNLKSWTVGVMLLHSMNALAHNAHTHSSANNTSTSVNDTLPSVSSTLSSSSNTSSVNNISASGEQVSIKSYVTSVEVFSAAGQFSATTEEKESSLDGFGIGGEFRQQNSPWALKADFFSTHRETKSGNLDVRSTYRELRFWALRFFPLDQYFSLYGGGGLGALSVLTKMKVMGDVKTLEGRAETLVAYILGARINFPSGIFVDLLRQSSYSPSFPNQNISSFAFQVGYSF